MKFQNCILFLLLAKGIIAQNEGSSWVIGYHSGGNPEYSIMHLNFSGNEMQIEYHFDETMHMRETCSNICDQSGKAILWTNGMQIFGKHGISVADTIAYDGSKTGYWNWFYTDSYGPLGFPKPDGAIILPVPDRQDEYSIIYHSASPHPTFVFQVDRILEARVRMRIDSTFELIFKDSLIGPVTQWLTGPILSTKHSNGRDWWIMFFKADSPTYYSHLLTPDGITFRQSGSVDTNVIAGFGQAVISNKGNFVARMDAIDFDEGQYITLYTFDRCSGELNRLETIQTTTGFSTGLAFSPSEQYLYADDNTNLWQWDLSSNDINASKSLVDTFDGFVQPGWFEMRFGPMKLAPDGKIYLIPSTGSSEYIHVIERPNLPFDQCQFKQHTINLRKPNGRSAPNLPNFRLGPIDGSICDSLGIDNTPVAKWRFEKNEINNEQLIRFIDLSFYEPDSWLWDFGDGFTSNEEFPIHMFDKGLYNVCLTVSNSYGEDTACQNIEIFTTDVDNVANNSTAFSIYPNPFSEFIELESGEKGFLDGSISLYDQFGKEIINQLKVCIPSKLFLLALPPGLYLLRLKFAGEQYNYTIIKI